MEANQSTERKEAGYEMSSLEISNETMKTTNKRQRQVSSSSEERLPIKKSRNTPDKDLVVGSSSSSSSNTGDKIKEETEQSTNLAINQNVVSSSTSKLPEESNKEARENDGSNSPLTIGSINEAELEEICNMSTDSLEFVDTVDITAEDDGTETSMKLKEESLDESFKRKSINITVSSTKETEIIGGLALSVECASDKEESSSESEKDDNQRPRTRTIIVKEEPNESELDVSSPEGEEMKEEYYEEISVHTKQNLEEKQIKLKMSPPAKKASDDSEDISDSNVQDEEYKPQTKRKARRSPNKRNTKSSKSKTGGRGVRKTTKGSKKAQQNKNLVKDDEDEDNSDDDKGNKTKKKIGNKASKSVHKSSKVQRERNTLAKGTSDTEDESNDDDSDHTKDSKQKKRGPTKPEDDKRILSLKKYIRTAGITVKSYQEIWSGCKSNAARIRRLKSLLEKHGVHGRPTLEKCKKVKERNERLKEASELDESNIISEGRITRSRKIMMANKSTVATPGTPSRYREARSTYKRIHTVVDSDDSE